MHVGDRHPKTSFEAVDIGGRRYQVGCSAALKAGIEQAEKDLGDVLEDLAGLDELQHASAIAHNEAVVRRGLEIAHGRNPSAAE
jgi:hypothetical protein